MRSNIFFNSQIQTPNENENEKKKEEAQILKEKRKRIMGVQVGVPLSAADTYLPKQIN